MVPLRGLAPGSACPVSPRLRGFVTVALASPRGGGALPLTLPSGVRTFLGGFRRRDRQACSACLFYLLLPRSARILVRFHPSRDFVHESTCSRHVFVDCDPRQLPVIAEE